MRNNLTIIRKDRKMTQKEVADKISISRTHYNKIEKGVRNPSHMVAFKLKNVLNCNYEDLFELN